MAAKLASGPLDAAQKLLDGTHRRFGFTPAPSVRIVEHCAYALTDPLCRFSLAQPNRGKNSLDVPGVDLINQLGSDDRVSIGLQRREPLGAVLPVAPALRQLRVIFFGYPLERRHRILTAAP